MGKKETIWNISNLTKKMLATLRRGSCRKKRQSGESQISSRNVSHTKRGKLKRGLVTLRRATFGRATLRRVWRATFGRAAKFKFIQVTFSSQLIIFMFTIQTFAFFSRLNNSKNHPRLLLFSSLNRQLRPEFRLDQFRPPPPIEISFNSSLLFKT